MWAIFAELLLHKNALAIGIAIIAVFKFVFSSVRVKYAISTRVPVRTKAKLHAVAIDHMAFIETNPERVKSYFHDPRVKYAA